MEHSNTVLKSSNPLQDTKMRGPLAVVEAEHEDHDHDVADIHSLIGVALVLGFVFMMLVDQLGGGGGHSHSSAGQCSIK